MVYQIKPFLSMPYNKYTFLPLLFMSFMSGVVLKTWLNYDCFSMKIIANKLYMHESIKFYFEEIEYASVNGTSDSSTIQLPITDPKLSDVFLSPPPPYLEGQTILGTIVSKDINNNPTNKGGDIYSIRVVFTDLGHALAVLPNDHKNGTYSFHVPLLWSGSVQIEVELILTSSGASYAQTLLYNEFIISQWTKKAVFQANSIREVTSCNFVYPLIDDYCELTMYNGMVPWYCKKPSRLPCDSFKYDQATIKLPSDYKVFSKFLSKQNEYVEIKLPVLERFVTPVKDFKLPELPLAAPHGISNTRPQGYFKNNEWVSLLFQNKRYDFTDIISCIMKKNFLLFGDGNTEFPAELINNKLAEFDKIENMETNSIFYPRLNTTIQYFGHGHPISQFDPAFAFSAEYVFSHPRKEVDAIVINLWKDFIFFHPDKLLLKWLQLRSLLLHWKKICPNVEIFLRSPHLRSTPQLSHQPVTFNNYNVKKAYRVFSLVFKDTPFHIMETWEMCVAFGGQHDVNPPTQVVDETLQRVMNVICPKV